MPTGLCLYTDTAMMLIIDMEMEMTNVVDLTAEFAALDAQIKELTTARSKIKEKLLVGLEYAPNKKGVLEAVVVGGLVDIVFTKTYPTTFSKDLAETLLSAEDFQRCHATAINPTVTPRIVTKSKAFA